MRKTTYAKKCITFSIVKSCTIPEVALVLTRGCNFQGPTQIYKSVLNLQFDGNRPRSGHSVCKQRQGGGGGLLGQLSLEI